MLHIVWKDIHIEMIQTKTTYMTAKSVTSFSGRYFNSVKSPRQYQKVKPNSVRLDHTLSDLFDLQLLTGY